MILELLKFGKSVKEISEEYGLKIQDATKVANFENKEIGIIYRIQKKLAV